MSASWSSEDDRIAALLQQGLGPIHVVSHEENRMTDTVDTTATEDSGWEPDENVTSYPEVVANPHNHTYTWSPKLPDGSMLVIRSQTAKGLAEAAEAVGPLARRLRAAWASVLGAPSGQEAPAAFAPQPQFQGATPPPFGPNVSVPAAPGYQGPPAPAAPQWGAPQAQPQQPARKEYPAPQGWYRLNVPFPGGKDQLHALAAQLGIPKGNPSKGGAYNFFGLNPAGQPGKAWYCAPEAAQAFVQYNPMPA